MESAQGAATRLQVRKERDLEETVGLGVVGGDEDLVGDRGEASHHPGDERRAEKFDQTFIASHAGGLPAGLDGEGQHGHIIDDWAIVDI